MTCDAISCIGKLTDGRLASMVLEIEAFAEDCARAVVVVSARQAPSSACAATLVDRDVSRAHGAVALRWTGRNFEQSVTIPAGYQRPWTRIVGNAASIRQGLNEPAPRDATPRSDVLEADD